MRFSFVQNYFDNRPMRCECSDWNEFVERMRWLSEQTGYKPDPRKKEYDVASSPLISPAIYPEENMSRANDNVCGWDIVMMDIDSGVDDIEIVKNHFKHFKYIIYSSPTCTAEKLKLRIVLPLNKTAPKERLSQIWNANEMWCSKLVDPSTKDCSRGYYVPARYTNKGAAYTHFFLVNDGIDLDWEELIRRYPSKPDADRFKVDNPLKKIKQKIYANNHGTPSLIITDDGCPFVYQNMIDDYRLTPAGGHHRAIYIFMVKVCYNAEKIGYPLTHEELVDMAQQLDNIDGGFYDLKKLQNSAKDAMEFTGM